MFKNIYRVMLKKCQKQNHNGFLTTIIFCRYDFFLLLRRGLSKNDLRERDRERGVCGVEGQEAKRERER